MSEPKKNKDGLIGGALVSPRDHAKIMQKKRQERAKAQAKAK